MEVVDEEFLRQAKLRMRCGAEVVIMAFDKKGQVATLEDNVCVLRENLDFPPGHSNVLSITAGLSEHKSCGIDFVNAAEVSKRTCRCVSFSGGLSNLSFSIRVLKSLGDAMRAIFLHHAGLNLSIVNPGGVRRASEEARLPGGGLLPCGRAAEDPESGPEDH